MPCLRFFYVANVSFNTIREHKILAKISEFTVHSLFYFLTLYLLVPSADNLCKQFGPRSGQAE